MIGKGKFELAKNHWKVTYALHSLVMTDEELSSIVGGEGIGGSGDGGHGSPLFRPQDFLVSCKIVLR